tara:strand:- start:467 stop:739 length:273 start_codon:yes stop_codon:yes gene_type:complete
MKNKKTSKSKLKDIQKLLIKIIEKKNKIKMNSIEKKLKFRYLEEGHLDSIELINFIISLEDRFNVKFTSKDTESENFRTLEGISKIILKK